MIRKTPKEMKRKKSNVSSQKKNPNEWIDFIHNPNITHSEYCVIKSWILPHRKCPAASFEHPTLVELHGKYIWPWPFTKIACKSEASTTYQHGCTHTIYMAVTGHSTPAFAYYIINRRDSSYSSKVKKKYCHIKEPHEPSQKMRFCQVVELEERFFALSFQGSVVVIEKKGADSDSFGITRTGRCGDRAVPSKACKQFREYLVKSSGEIFLVFLISRNSISVVDDVEVLRLDTEKLSWAQVGNIGERAFFLEAKGCVKFGACERGFKKNCIYFAHSFIDDWMVFDMETRLILPHLDVEIETQ